MADFDLEAMAKAAGINVPKVLAAIETTQALETELYAIIYPMISAYRQSLGYVEDTWGASQVTQNVVKGMLATVASYGEQAVLTATPKVGQWAERVEKWHRQRWSGVIKAATRLDVSQILAAGDVQKLVEATTQTNVGLIKGLSDDIYKRIEQTVWKAYADGDGPAKLAKTLREKMEFAPARAKLIARDQLGKYSGALDKARHEEAGLEEYKWKTVGDDRVRPTHKANNGKRFSYKKKPPSTGHPGEDIQCRCKAQAILFSAAEEAELEAAGLGGLDRLPLGAHDARRGGRYRLFRAR